MSLEIKEAESRFVLACVIPPSAHLPSNSSAEKHSMLQLWKQASEDPQMLSWLIELKACT